MTSDSDWEKRSAAFRYPWLKRYSRENWFMLERADGVIPCKPLGVNEAIEIIFENGLSIDVPPSSEKYTSIDNFIPSYMGKRPWVKLPAVDIYQYLCDLDKHGYGNFLFGIDELTEGDSALEFGSDEELLPVQVYKYIFKPGSYWPLCSFYSGYAESETEEGVIEIYVDKVTPVKTLVAYTGVPERIFSGTFYWNKGVLYKDIDGKLVDTRTIPLKDRIDSHRGLSRGGFSADEPWGGI